MAGLSPRVFAMESETPIRVGLIGCGWYGKTDLFHLLQVAPVDVVGLADVDQRMLQEASALVAQRQPSGKQPPTYGDYRKLLREQRPDVAIIGTPDHWHCLPMIEACQAGADVYVQKPISWDVGEGQAMVAAAKQYQRTVQVGLQRRSTPHLLEARDRFLNSGKLGKVAYVGIHSYYGDAGALPPSEPPPEHLDWETYVGPATWRAYCPGIHPRRWRGCREFSNGQTGDLCVHFFDLVRYFLDLKWPQRISASGGIMMRPPGTGINTHDTQTAVFDFPDLQVVWTQRNWGQNPDPDYPWGAVLYGEHGTLKLGVRSYDFLPNGKGSPVHGDYVDQRDEYPEDQQHKATELFAAPATRAHMLDFLNARRLGVRPVADISEGHISSASCILANLSMELDRELVFDPKQGKVVDDDEANGYLARPYRNPWTRPSLDDL